MLQQIHHDSLIYMHALRRFVTSPGLGTIQWARLHQSLVPVLKVQHLGLSHDSAIQQAIQYLAIAPRRGEEDLIYHIHDFDDRLLDVSIYKDFKQNKHYFSVHFNVTTAGISFYRQLLASHVLSGASLIAKFQPHIGNIEIALEIEPPMITNGRRVIRPILALSQPGTHRPSSIGE